MREGILKHCSLPHARQLEAMEPGGVGQRFILREQPSLEAQLCNLSDEIAYNAHDIDDGVRSGLLSMDQLQGVPLVAHYSQETLKKYPHVKDRRWLFETIRMMLSDQVYDVIGNTQEALKAANITNSLEVKRHPMLVKFSEPMQLASLELKGFLSQNLYRHSRVQKTTEQAKEMIRDLFLRTSTTPRKCPRLTKTERTRSGPWPTTSRA
jgi:dGTPase